MKKGRVEAIRQFADKLTEWISSKNDRQLYRSLAYDPPWDLRRRLLRAQQKGLPLGLDEYAKVWLSDEEGRIDEGLIRDLVCLRVVEQLQARDYFKEHPEDTLETAPEEPEQGDEGMTA